ncbi:acid protease [Favolaschia claudopus]|uniref:Acid protease n=1 Tax=Favolaschia claudopus TaxID=2862362 RepID=A0AAW0E014_9AGAR
MFSPLFSSLFVSSILTIADVDANPLPSRPTGFSVPIKRYFHQKPPVNTSTLPTCDVLPIIHECEGLVHKYRNVDENFNNGIGFGPIFDPGEIVKTEAEEPFIPPVLSAPKKGEAVPLQDYVSENTDMLYYGSMKVGTPGQELTVDIDTGSADLWFPSDCMECVNREFVPSMSSTYNDSDESFTVSYGSGAVSGKLVQDVVSIAGLTVPSQSFGIVSEASGDFNDLPNDGLLGLAFGSIAQSKKPTFFESLIAGGQVSPLFSIHFARRPADHGHDDSEMCFGCMNPLKMLGPAKWLPVLTQAYWSVSMEALILKVNTDQDLRFPTRLRAIIDTGTTFIYLPRTVVSEFYTVIPGSKRVSQNEFEFYTFPCSTVLGIDLMFSNHRFSINLADFNLGMVERDSLDCVGGILPLSDDFPPDVAIIGDEFLKSWYTVFDYTGGPNGGARVGFARSINQH